MFNSDYSTLDDEILVRLIVQARGEALSALYDRYSRLVSGLALNSTGEQSMAATIIVQP